MSLPISHLTEYALDLIANDVRTLPLSEVGRHVMPLLHHVTAMAERQCELCLHWVKFDVRGDRTKGECRNPLVRATVNVFDGCAATRDDTEAFAVMTPFDWSCSGFERQVDDAGGAQQSVGGA